MSNYNFELQAGKTLTLQTAGKYCDRDIEVNAVGGGSFTTETWIFTLEDDSTVTKTVVVE